MSTDNNSSQPNGSTASGSEVVLIVDDEDAVRKTFQEWLDTAELGIQILAAPDAETALAYAGQHIIDLAVLDWNLGSGDNGLQLLQDLVDFCPDVAAIMITGFAQQATPLDAMRMGVRDYLDKNHDLTREKFLEAITRQLDLIRPRKRERLLHARLKVFQQTVEKILPLVQSAAALNDPVPLPEAIASLFRFLQRATGAAAGALYVRSYDPQREPAEISRVYDTMGSPLPVSLLPFSQSLPGAVVSMGEACVVNDLQNPSSPGAELQEHEKGHTSLLASPLLTGSSLQVVVELFDKNAPGGFTDEDRQLVIATSDFGGELFRNALAEHRTQQALFDAVAAALQASETLVEALNPSAQGTLTDPPPAQVLDRLQEDLRPSTDSVMSSEDSIRLAEAIRVLAVCHGPVAVQHCLKQIEQLQHLLSTVSGMEEGS